MNRNIKIVFSVLVGSSITTMACADSNSSQRFYMTANEIHNSSLTKTNSVLVSDKAMLSFYNYSQYDYIITPNPKVIDFVGNTYGGWRYTNIAPQGTWGGNFYTGLTLDNVRQIEMGSLSEGTIVFTGRNHERRSMSVTN